jgi:hypothetical protein
VSVDLENATTLGTDGLVYTASSVVGRGVLVAADEQAARDVTYTASRSIGINVMDYGADPVDPSTHQAAFEAAIADAVALNGREIVIPGGDWYVEGLVIPKRCTLKFLGHGASCYSQRSVAGLSVAVGTRLIRTGNLPVFIGIGGVPPTVAGGVLTDNNTAEIDWFDMVRDVVFEDLTVENQNGAATAPLVDLRGCGGLRFNRVVLFDDYLASNLLELRATMDSSFTDCYLLGGATSLRIHDGSDTYWASNALWFNSCDFENYKVHGVDIGDDAGSHPTIPRNLHFSQHKQECWFKPGGTTSGIVLRRATTVMFTKTYLAHDNCPDPILDVRRVFGVYGDIGFVRQFSAEYVEPSCRVSLGVNTSLVDLDVFVHTGPDETVNVVNQADVNNKSIDVRINGLSHKFNGGTRLQRFDTTQIVWQEVDGTAGTCQYIFSKGDLNRWSVGNIEKVNNDIEQFAIIASDKFGNSNQMMLLRTYSHAAGGTNPATATYRDMALSGFLNLFDEKLGWINLRNLNSPPASVVGGMRVYASSNNLMIDVLGLPISQVEVKGHTHTAADVVGAAAWVGVPANSSAPGSVNQIASDGSYLYVCVSPDIWKRIPYDATPW